jgi:hypothetical protein
MRRASPSAAALAAALAVTGLSACRCTEDIAPLPIATEQIDVFEQKLAAEVDVLWMVDNSGSMAAEQNKIAARFNEFFSQLIRSAVDYHIGVVTSDPAENGVLRAYNGPAVQGCNGCRFISKDIPCANPDVDISTLTDETAIENRLLQECPAQLVFRRLVRVGIDGSSFEEGFPQAAAALGAKDIDRNTGIPLNNPPPENAGFVRQQASLYIVFVSDEDEGGKSTDGTPVRYYQRLFEGLKGAGNENKVAVAAITGYPFDDALPPIEEVCDVLATTFDANTANDDPRAASLKEALRNFNRGCFDLEADPNDGNSRAETGGRYIELACRTGGVVANMCEADYSTALDALGANAAGLLRKFTLSKPQPQIDFGRDCQPFTEDDKLLDCDDDGSKGGALDGPLCVRAVPLDGTEPVLVPRQRNSGWEFEATTNSVRFDGDFLPKPGTQIEIQYALRLASDRSCGAALTVEGEPAGSGG